MTVAYGEDDVSVEISDDGAAEGRALLGMRERVAVYGGELTAAALADGGWRVIARLPTGMARVTSRLRNDAPPGCGTS